MRRIIATLAVTLLLVCTSARADFTFIHASDTHAGSPENVRADAALFKEMAGLPNKPAFVVVTGDIVDYGTDAEYAQFKKAAANLGDSIKLYLAPGNHDVRWNPRGKEGYTLGANAKLYQSWDYQNVHFVTLDSTVLLEHWGHISQEQLDWLKGDLEKVGTEKPVVIGFHHWICKHDSQTMMDNEQQLLDVIAPYNIVLWLQGHGHTDVEWNVNGTPAMMVRGLYQGSYNVIDVTSDEMRVSKSFRVEPKKAELLQGKNDRAATEMRKTRPIMTIPLTKRPAPKWDAVAKLDSGIVRVGAFPGELPHDANLEYRIDTDNARRLPASGATYYTPVDVKTLLSGVHVVTVAATLPDKRVYEKTSTITVPGVVSPAWERQIGGAVQSRLVRDGDLLYVTSMGNDLVALNASDGAEKFRAKTGGPIFSAACVKDGVAYFGSADHFVYAADANTGEVKWKHSTDGAVLAGPNVAQGIVCVGSADTKIYGLDVTDGHVVWTVKGSNMYQSQSATDGERFFVGGWDNHFRCIDAKTGHVTWDLELGRPQRLAGFSAYAPAITSPAVGGGKVFVSTNDGILHGLNIADGKEAWRVDWKRMGYSSPCYHDGRVYCALNDEGKTFCVNADSGEMLWTADTGSVIYDSSFCFGGGNVFIGCVNGTVTAIHADDGKVQWRYRLGPGHLLASPAADDKFVYISSMTGVVTALPVNAVDRTDHEPRP